MGNCRAPMSTVKIMPLKLVPLFGYYTFINNQISAQRLQASELREGTESIGGIEFFTYPHKTSHPVNNLAFIPARHNTFGSCLSPWLFQNWQLHSQPESFWMVRQVCFVFLPSRWRLLWCWWNENKSSWDICICTLGWHHMGMNSRRNKLKQGGQS